MAKDRSTDNIVHVDFQRADPLPRSLEKQDRFSQWIEQGMVMVMLDPRQKGVHVPAHFLNEPELRLNFSYQFHISDFTFDSQSICATLTFQQGLFCCIVPWEAVFALYSYPLDQGVVWPEDIPKELATDSLTSRAKTPKSRLQLVTDPDEGPRHPTSK